MLAVYLGRNFNHQFHQPFTQCHSYVPNNICTKKVTRYVKYSDVASLMCINSRHDQYGLCGNCGVSCFSVHHLFRCFWTSAHVWPFNILSLSNFSKIRDSIASCFCSLVRCSDDLVRKVYLIWNLDSPSITTAPPLYPDLLHLTLQGIFFGWMWNYRCVINVFFKIAPLLYAAETPTSPSSGCSQLV